ncbi:MAG: 16S rRNA (cytidine(1402)-2'-O)-methyltransferase [Salinispira sp.]
MADNRAELYIVATPIGNLSDITLRALETLRSVDVIACEDTRHSLRLLNAHGISKPLISCRAHNESAAVRQIISRLEAGENIAFVSDAGTPGISDPGALLVRKVRDEGFRVVPIPGASALSAIMSISGFSGKRVIFEGFLSPKSGKRKKQIKDLLEMDSSFILYESPFRIVKLLADMAELCLQRSENRKILCGRELTKVYEEVLEGHADELYNILAARPSIKGEFVVLVSSPMRLPSTSQLASASP